MNNEAQELKQKADDLYRTGNYQHAFQTYKEAAALSQVPAIYNNASACLIQMKEFESAIFYAYLTITKCSVVLPTECARAYERAATALQALSSLAKTPKPTPGILDQIENILKNPTSEEDLKNLISKLTSEELIDLALKQIKLGLIESNSPSLHKLSKSLLSQKASLLISPEKADELRVQGNQLVSQNKYTDAIKKYTEAIQRNPKDYRIYTNRALCYSRLMSWSDAIKDCEKCIELQPKDYPKSYLRLAKIYSFLKLFHRAVEVLNKYLKENENSKEKGVEDNLNAIRNEKNEVLRRAAEYNAKDEQNDLEAKERMEKTKSDGEVEKVVKDGKVQMFLKIMGEEKSRGEAMKQYMEDRDLRDKIEYLTAAGIVRMG